MAWDTFILADSDDNIVKVVIAVVVAIIWGIGALANMVKKQQSRDAQSRAEMEAAMRAQMEAARRNQAAAEALARGQAGGGGGPPPLYQVPQQVPPAQRSHHGPAVPPMRPRAAPQRQPQQPQRRPAARSVPPLPPPPPRPRGAVMPPKRTKKADRRQQQQRSAEPVLVEIEPSFEGEGPNRPGVFESEIGTGSAPASPARRLAAAAPKVRLTPQTLRQQFILTEILQPPLALRQQRES